MVRHIREKATWTSKRGNKTESHTILGHAAMKPNAYAGSMESIRVTLAENEKTDDRYLDVRNWVESKNYTGPVKSWGMRLERHHLIEILSMLPEIKEFLDIEDGDVQDEIEERKVALEKGEE